MASYESDVDAARLGESRHPIASDKSVEELIHAIQERPILWDKKNKNYSNRLRTFREWKKVGVIMGSTNVSVKRKWRNLRDTFVREYKKYRENNDDDDVEMNYRGTWAHFESMLFLKNTIKSRSSHASYDDDTLQMNYKTFPEYNAEVADEEMSCRKDLEDSDTTDDVRVGQRQTPNDDQIPSTSQRPVMSNSNYYNEIKVENDPFREILDIEQEQPMYPRKEKIQLNDQDDDLHWFKSILPYLKQMSAIRKLKFRTTMQEILIKELSKKNPVSS